MAEALSNLSEPVHWFALHVKSRHEKSVVQQLQEKGLEQYLPLYRTRHSWSDRAKQLDLPLFSNYVFCRSRFEDRFAVLRTPGILSVVGFGGKAASIPDDEIETIRRMVGSGLPVCPWPFLGIGDRVRIKGGSLDGMEGILVRERGLHRIVVSVELLQRSVAVEIDRNLVAIGKPMPLSKVSNSR